MDVHFFSTANDFSYVFYLAVMSALKTQNAGSVNLWVTERSEDRYFKLLEHVQGVNIQNVVIPNLKATIDKPEDSLALLGVRHAHLKDLLGWTVLYEQGGVLLDLDTFCLQDMCQLVEEKEVAVCVSTTWRFGPSLFPFNNAMVVARPKSVVIKEALEESIQALSRDIDESFMWGISGPMALSNAVHKNYHLVNFLRPGSFGVMVEELSSSVIDLYKEEANLAEGTKAVHLYASTYRKVLATMDSEFISGSNILYARLVKQTLDEKEWLI